MDALLKGPLGNFTLGSTTFKIGRAPGNQLLVQDPEVSSFHAEIVPQGHGYAIVDLASRNGTFVNGQKLLPRTPRSLNVGDSLRFGATVFHFTAGAAPLEPTKLADTAVMPDVNKFRPPPARSSGTPPQKKEPQKKDSGDGTPTWVKVAGGLASLATVFAAIWGVYTFIQRSNTLSPTPTPVATASIPQLHGSYTGSYTNTSTGLQFAMTMTSLSENADGSFTANGNDGVCPVTYQGKVNSDNTISFTATEAVGTTSTGAECGARATFSGSVFSDGHLAGTWQGSVNGAGGTWSVS